MPFDQRSHRQHGDDRLLSNEVQVGPSRRRKSGRKGQGAGLGLAEDEAGEEEVEEDEDDKMGTGVMTIA